MEIEITKRVLWSDAIFEFELKEINNDIIYDYYQKYRNESNGVIRSNMGGWQADVKYGDNEEIDEVIRQITHSINHIFSDIYQHDRKLQLINMWLNANSIGNSNAYHTHPGCSYSAVYYIKTNNEPTNGEISFCRPESFGIASVLGHDTQSEFLRQYASFTPKQGFAYVFPAWLMHQVSSNLDGYERVVLAMNCN